MRRKQYKNIQIIIAASIIIFLTMYMIYALKFERPSEMELNYSDKTFEVIYESGIIDFSQTLDIFKNDRTIKLINIYFENNLQNNDMINIAIKDGLNVKTVIVGCSDFSNGWYTLPFSYEEINSASKLIISANNITGTLGIGVTSIDLMNIGECIIDDTNDSHALAIQTNLTINNIIWDELGYVLIAIWVLVSFFGLFCACKYDKSVAIGKGLFLLAIGLNIVSLIVLDPYFMETSHIAENSLNFYYLTKKYSILESLTKMDAGYLPFLQRLIAIIYIKILGLGTKALYCMQITGVLIDIIILSAFNLNIFKGKTHRSIRFALSLCFFVLFIHPTMSTYFNFIYIGYFLIALSLTCNLDELKKYQFIFICIVSFLICISKGFYAVMLPIGIIELVLFYDTAGKRKNIYAVTISAAASLEVGYAFIVGDSWNKWFGTLNNIQVIFYNRFVIAIVAILIMICVVIFLLLKMLIYWYKIPKEFRQKWMNSTILCFLFLGSFVLGTIAFKQISIVNLFDWGRAWYVPSAMALVLLLCEFVSMAEENKKYFRILTTLVLMILEFDIALSLLFTRDKLYCCYRCVSWEVYRDYFDNTIVPVFIYDQRFGTLADGYKLWYTGKKPIDNYAYGSPYEILPVEASPTETNEIYEYTNCFSLKDTLVNQSLYAVYLNYINDVGNANLQLFLYDDKWNYLGTMSQMSPLSSKTVGFISDNPIVDVAYLLVKTTEGEEAYVTEDAYFVAK